METKYKIIAYVTSNANTNEEFEFKTESMYWSAARSAAIEKAMQWKEGFEC